MERLRQRFPHVLVLAFEPEGVAVDRCRPTPPGCAAGPTSRSPPTSSTHVRGPARAGRDGAAARRAFEDVRRLEAASLMRLHTMRGHGVRTVRRHRAGRLRRAGRGRSVPVHRTDRCRQDQHPRRGLLRALRPGSRGAPAAAACAATTRRRVCRPRCGSRSTLRGRRMPITRSPAWERPSSAAAAPSPRTPRSCSRSSPGPPGRRCPRGSTRPATWSAGCSASGSPSSARWSCCRRTSSPSSCAPTPRSAATCWRACSTRDGSPRSSAGW